MDEATATIAELEKRIAELEAELKKTIASSDRVCDSYAQENQRFHDAIAAERQRREECEAVLRKVANAPNRIAENSRIIADYFGEWN